MLETLQMNDCTTNKLKFKVIHMTKIIYLQTIEWRNQTGQGVLQTDGIDSFESLTLKRCQDFAHLDEIFGTKISINPPFLLETVLVAEDLPNFDNVEDERSSPPPANLSKVATAIACPTKDVPQASTSSHKKTADKKKYNSIGVTGIQAICGLREDKNAVDLKKLEIESRRLDFEMKNWDDESEFRNQKRNLEKQKMEQEMEIKKYEIEMKSRTQLELAKLSKN